MLPEQYLTQPCPKETALFGSAVLDGSADEYETYFVIKDDDLTKMVGMEWCIQNNQFGFPEHFRGFRPRIDSPTSGQTMQTFGDMTGSDPKDMCHSIDLTGEMMYFQVFYDDNDVEGFVLTAQDNTRFSFRANGFFSDPKM